MERKVSTLVVVDMLRGFAQCPTTFADEQTTHGTRGIASTAPASATIVNSIDLDY